MRLIGKTRQGRIPAVFDRGATQPGGMQRRSNAAGLSPRAACSPGWRAVQRRPSLSAHLLSTLPDSTVRSSGQISRSARLDSRRMRVAAAHTSGLSPHANGPARFPRQHKLWLPIPVRRGCLASPPSRATQRRQPHHRRRGYLARRHSAWLNRPSGLHCRDPAETGQKENLLCRPPVARRPLCCVSARGTRARKRALCVPGWGDRLRGR